MHGRNAHGNVTAHTKRARISGLFYFALEEGSSKTIHQLLFSFAGRPFLLGFPPGRFLLSLFLDFLLSLFLGYLFLRLALSFLFSLFLGFFLHYPPFFLGGLFLFCYAAFLRRCFFLRCYFPLLRDLPLRSFFTRLLFGSHAFLRVGYPELSIYNKGKKTSKLAVCKRQRKHRGVASIGI